MKNNKTEKYTPIDINNSGKETSNELFKRLDSEVTQELKKLDRSDKSETNEKMISFLSNIQELLQTLRVKLKSSDPKEQFFLCQALTRLQTALKIPHDYNNNKQLALLANEIPYKSSAYWKKVASQVLLMSAAICFFAFFLTILATYDPTTFVVARIGAISSAVSFVIGAGLQELTSAEHSQKYTTERRLLKIGSIFKDTADNKNVNIDTSLKENESGNTLA